MKYFVLKPDGGDCGEYLRKGDRGAQAHARASRIAMRAYADSIQYTDNELCLQLMDWVNGIATEKEDEDDINTQSNEIR